MRLCEHLPAQPFHPALLCTEAQSINADQGIQLLSARNEIVATDVSPHATFTCGARIESHSKHLLLAQHDGSPKRRALTPMTASCTALAWLSFYVGLTSHSSSRAPVSYSPVAGLLCTIGSVNVRVTSHRPSALPTTNTSIPRLAQQTATTAKYTHKKTSPCTALVTDSTTRGYQQRYTATD